MKMRLQKCFIQFQNADKQYLLNQEKLKKVLQLNSVKINQSIEIAEKVFFKLQQTQEKQSQALKIKVGKEQIYSELCDELVEAGFLKNKSKMGSFWESFIVCCEILQGQFPLIIMIAGTSGSGKSTISSVIGSKFGIQTVLSTDTVRHTLRNLVDKEKHPCFFLSSYQAGKCLEQEKDSDGQKNIIRGYKRQNTIVQEELEKIIEEQMKNNKTLVIEGVHLTPKFMFQMYKKYKYVIPIQLYINKETKHLERFAVRSKYMTLVSKNNKYVEHFQNIRHIQKWLQQKCDDFLIPRLNNVNMDQSIQIVQKVVIQYLRKMKDNKIETHAKNAYNVYKVFNSITNNGINKYMIKQYLQQKQTKEELVQKYIKDISQQIIPQTDKQSVNNNFDPTSQNHIKFNFEQKFSEIDQIDQVKQKHSRSLSLRKKRSQDNGEVPSKRNSKESLGKKESNSKKSENNSKQFLEDQHIKSPRSKSPVKQTIVSSQIIPSLQGQLSNQSYSIEQAYELLKNNKRIKLSKNTKMKQINHLRKLYEDENQPLKSSTQNCQRKEILKVLKSQHSYLIYIKTNIGNSQFRRQNTQYQSEDSITEEENNFSDTQHHIKDKENSSLELNFTRQFSKGLPTFISEESVRLDNNLTEDSQDEPWYGEMGSAEGIDELDEEDEQTNSSMHVESGSDEEENRMQIEIELKNEL